MLIQQKERDYVSKIYQRDVIDIQDDLTGKLGLI
jgi:hypothetical protein